MGAEARRWVSPALCGCELEITAEWSGKESDDGKMYQHPSSAPGFDKSGKSRNTVQFVRIITQCATHAGWENSLTWNPAVMGGYCDLTTAGDGVLLYMNHWRFTNLLTRLSLCDCTPNHCHDASDDSLTVHQHPHHTAKCSLHKADDDQHTNALKLEDRAAKIRTIFEALPSASVSVDANDKAAAAKFLALTQGVPVDSVSLPDRVSRVPCQLSLDDDGQIVAKLDQLDPSDQKKFQAAVKALK